MRRREVLSFAVRASAAGAFATKSWGANAQPNMPRVAYLMDRSGPNEFERAFLIGLREHGYIPGQNIDIEYRWSGGKSERLPALAHEIAAAKFDLIVTAGSESVKALTAATATIPIVMASSQDAVGDGLVASLARPGGNVTGRSVYARELTPKRVALLAEVVPGLTRIGAIWNALNPAALAQWRETETAAHTLGIAAEPLKVRFPDDLDSVMGRAKDAGVTGIIILSDSVSIANRTEIGASARQHGLPTIFTNKAYLQGGGLMSYGPDVAESYRLSAAYVDRVLNGADPANLPVEQPTAFELVINLKTASALGLTIPPTLLARADEVIE
jgi:putative ABC transport system substrate-binding protein